MTTFLYNLLPLTAGAERMAVQDPSGWTLTLISVCVVFAALIILYFIYKFSGDIFSGKFKRKPKKCSVIPSGAEGSEVAAAIALALDMEEGGDAYAAIAAALHLYYSESVHDVEPGIVTIRRKDSGWTNKALNFRKTPK